MWMQKKEEIDKIWETIQEETLRRVQAEPVLASFFLPLFLNITRSLPL